MKWEICCEIWKVGSKKTTDLCTFVIDPTKVTRSALQNAASVAAMVLTTESLVSDIKEPAQNPAMPVDPGMGGMY